MFIADTDADARRLLQRLLLEIGLSADLDELDRRVAEQISWTDAPTGHEKRAADLGLLQELMAATKSAASTLRG